MLHEFHLSPRESGRGVSCAADGAFIGTVPLLRRSRRDGKDAWHLRDCGQLSEQISERYGLPIDMSSKTGGLRVIAGALNHGDVARAQIATLLLGIPDPPQLSKRACTRDGMIKLIRDLHWSGLLKWDTDEHPRWPAGTADGKGGQFAPKGESGETDTSFATEFDAGDLSRSYTTQSAAVSRTPRMQLADADNVVSDAVDSPLAEAARAAAAAQRNDNSQLFEHDGAPKLILAAADEEKDSRFGIGDNYPPPEELIPQRLQQSPLGPPIQFLDNFLDITGPGNEANLGAATLQMRALLNAIHKVDPNYVYESIDPPGGLEGMSWQGRLNVIHGLQADLAAAIYRVRGDIRPLQEVTLEFMQRTTNAAYDEAVELYNAGKLKIRLSPQEAIGNYMVGLVRARLRAFFNGLRIPMGPGSAIRINSRAYDSSSTPPSYRLPDGRVGDFAFDTTLQEKMPSDPQIRGFLSADFAPRGVVIVRPNQLGGDTSYIIWRTDGD